MKKIQPTEDIGSFTPPQINVKLSISPFHHPHDTLARSIYYPAILLVQLDNE